MFWFIPPDIDINHVFFKRLNSANHSLYSIVFSDFCEDVEKQTGHLAFFVINFPQSSILYYVNIFF